MASFLTSATIDRRAQCFRHDGTAIDWRMMLDINLQPTDDATRAFVVIYEWCESEFTAIDLRLFREHGSHSEKHRAWLNSALSEKIVGCAINVAGRFFRLTDDSIIPFTLIDLDGAHIAVFELPETGLYHGIDLRSIDVDVVECLH